MEGSKSKVFTYVILAVVIVVIGSVLVFTSIGKTSKAQVTTTVQASTTAPVSTTLKSTTTIAQNPKNILIPYAQPSCPVYLYQIDTNIINTNGLAIYNLSGTNDYVIAPGNTAVISYDMYLNNALSFSTSNEQSFKSAFTLNIINVAQLYNATNITNSIFWRWNYSVPDSSGVNISYTPTNEVLTYNSVIPINALISVASNAPGGTYWMSLSPGPCNDGPFGDLLTVGNNAFNGVYNGYVGPG